MTEVVGRVAFLLLAGQFEVSRLSLEVVWFSYMRPGWTRHLLSVTRREGPDHFLQCLSKTKVRRVRSLQL